LDSFFHGWKKDSFDMADEITVSASIRYEDSEDADESLSLEDILADVATKKYTKVKVSVGTSEEAVPLGESTSPGWAMFINRDGTNFVSIKVATSGAIFAKLLPGEFALLRLGSGAQAPFWIADTAACQCEVFIVQT